MDPLVAKAYTDRAEMIAKNDYYFPKGYNNMSSSFKRVGEGFYEPGSTPYDEDFYGDDSKAPKAVWDSSYNVLEQLAKDKVDASKS